jgi:histidinol-phosphate aminotransferase
MDWITEHLAIGNIDDALSLETLRAAGITAVLGLNDFPTFLAGSGFEWRRVRLIDGPGNSSSEIMDALEALDGFLTAGHRVLVHCTEGVSRAPFVTACYLARQNGWEIEAALEYISQHRTIANPHPELRLLWQDLPRGQSPRLPA